MIKSKLLMFFICILFAALFIFTSCEIPQEDPVLNFYTLSLESSSDIGGSIIVDTVNTDNILSGTIITVTAIPETDWMFEGWAGNHIGAENPLIITINSNTSLTASFFYDVLIPTGLTAQANGTNSIILTWDDNSSDETYTLFYSTTADGFYSELYNGTETQYTSTNLQSNSTYFFKIQAETYGFPSEFSEIVSGTTDVHLPLDTPTGLTVGSPTLSSLAIDWDSVSEATGYRLYRDTNQNGSFTILRYTGSNLSFTDTNLLQGVTYYYKVACYNQESFSDKSSSISGTTAFIPATPLNLTFGSMTYSSITLFWNSVIEAEGYKLYWDLNENGSFLSNIDVGNDLSYSFTNLTYGTTYYYKISSYNTYGESSKSFFPISATIPTPNALITFINQSPWNYAQVYIDGQYVDTLNNFPSGHQSVSVGRPVGTHTLYVDWPSNTYSHGPITINLTTNDYTWAFSDWP
jgi:hypothetical protein